jgi:hypothetical protein
MKSFGAAADAFWLPSHGWSGEAPALRSKSRRLSVPSIRREIQQRQPGGHQDVSVACSSGGPPSS